MGTRTRIAAHNDTPHNLACVAVGRRRFTLFPREQFRNLYLGPVDNTPAGRAVSMVDFHAPDLARHPRFADALSHAEVAELDAGDALYIPALWWHHVEGLAPFNVLVNYWWRETPRWLGAPQDALNHAMLRSAICRPTRGYIGAICSTTTSSAMRRKRPRTSRRMAAASSRR